MRERCDDVYTAATHALCNAHALRELVYIIDTAPESFPPVEPRTQGQAQLEGAFCGSI